MAKEFAAPDFVDNNNPEDIQNRMMGNLPADIDDMPGGFPYDFTMPTALEKSELIQFHLVQTLKLMFPMWAWDEYLDLHAAQSGLTRKPAGYAHGTITIEGIENTEISAGTIFCTAATDSSSSIEFVTNTAVTIGSSGKVDIAITAVQAGKISNVKANTITLASKSINGVTKIYNSEATSGGTEAESDDELRDRIQEANEADFANFIGNDSDYRRWAKEVTGVGEVMVIPEASGPGTVKLIITDSNGEAANSALIQAVYNYIVSPDDRLARKAPIGATVEVTAPTMIGITYTGTIMLKAEATLADVIADYRAALQSYYETAREDGVLRYIRVSAILSAVSGVKDFDDFYVNGGTENIIINADESPQTASIAFVEGGGG